MKKNILLVDDEKDIREVLVLALADLGYQVSEAENGKEALDKFREIQPPIVLTDPMEPTAGTRMILEKVNAK